VNGDVDGGAEGLELLDRGRPIDVGGYEQWSASPALQVASELRRDRRLAHALQAHEHHRDRARLARQRRVDRPH
jgi:hypothetical protein